jgi:putative chitinase
VTFAEWRSALVTIEPHGKPWILDGLADAMPMLIERFEINTALRQQHFLSQCAHESDHFQTTREYASGAAYEGRKDLGNTHKGDGQKFRGRGLIQLTGRANYSRASIALGEPYVDEPALVERFPAAAIVSGWFWLSNGLNQLADQDDVRDVTRRVNGGLNGLDSRRVALGLCRTAIA